ncbi:FAD-dependent oxidoreductase [Aurantimonas sp. VKM B-3413]|uniref:FAD-dependent oxidoreductase n=1 Tax=Aurantimonas sp. VKM B-3413 TaxID=2779401 RepID=UPI001E5A48C5|nr:FAD-dependent oxidoreductase [Aurantimonas sp. VKM B-3413]MCB8836199.1 FAD-dependent oxidoreductase [Aurantimonas sp. VKM B-3413]
MRHDVCALDDIPETGVREFEVTETRILFVRSGDAVFATGAICPHKGAPLKNGTRVGNHLICPWHHAQFDLTTGDHIQPPGQGCLARFTVWVEDGRVLVDLPEHPRQHRPEVDPITRRIGGSKVAAIVGAGAAGLACAQELVRQGFDGRIVLISMEDEPPYDRTDLSKTYLQGKKEDADLPLTSFDTLKALGIEFLAAEVERIDAAARSIGFAAGGPPDLSYDVCFAAPGSDAKHLPLPGADSENVLTLRQHWQAADLVAAAATARDIVIVGAGFIAMEAAAGLVQQGRNVTVIAREKLPFAKRFGEAVAGQISDQHREKGVRLITEAEIAEFETDAGRTVCIRLKSGDGIGADLVILAVGARPRIEIFGDLAADETSVEVSSTLEASPGLFVGGDVAKFPLPARDYATRIEHWRVAEQHGRHAAGAMLGSQVPFSGVPFFWSAQYGAIHYVGHAADHDDVHIEGDLSGGSYTAFYIKDGSIVAALGRGKADTTADLHAVMLADPTPSRARLEAAGWRPKALIQGG